MVSYTKDAPVPLHGHRIRNPAKNCGVHCNLTHDKTYFILYFFWYLYLCIGLMITVESARSFVLAADEEMSVFVSIFALIDFSCMSPGIFFVVCVEHAMVTVVTNRKPINNFAMTSHFRLQSEPVFENIFHC
jgi:hypothetical protein